MSETVKQVKDKFNPVELEDERYKNMMQQPKRVHNYSRNAKNTSKLAPMVNPNMP